MPKQAVSKVLSYLVRLGRGLGMPDYSENYAPTPLGDFVEWFKAHPFRTVLLAHVPVIIAALTYLGFDPRQPLLAELESVRAANSNTQLIVAGLMFAIPYLFLLWLSTRPKPSTKYVAHVVHYGYDWSKEEMVCQVQLRNTTKERLVIADSSLTWREIADANDDFRNLAPRATPAIREIKILYIEPGVVVETFRERFPKDMIKSGRIFGVMLEAIDNHGKRLVTFLDAMFIQADLGTVTVSTGSIPLSCGGKHEPFRAHNKSLKEKFTQMEGAWTEPVQEEEL